MLTGKVVVVTGASSGIGYQAALDFARSGTQVIGVGRDQQRCNQARERILSLCADAKVTFLVADLASQAQVKGLASRVAGILEARHNGRLDVLVNNAGVYMGRRILTGDGIETTFAVNHLAPFLLTYLLLPHLVKTDESRVITVSSGSHYNTWFIPRVEKNPFFYFGLWAYKVSKLSNILFTRQFNLMRKRSRPQAFAVDPGLVNTDIGIKGTGGLAQAVWRNRQKLGTSPEQPAKTILYLAETQGLDCLRDVYWHDCAPKQPSAAALNDKLAKCLWEESCNLFGIPSDWNSK